MQRIEISNNHPIPPPGRGRFDGFKYPWDKLQIGESFLVKPGTKIAHACALASRAAHRLNRKFRCKTTADGIRVWRVQ